MEWTAFGAGSDFPFILLLTGWVKRADQQYRLKRSDTVIPVVRGFVA